MSKASMSFYADTMQLPKPYPLESCLSWSPTNTQLSWPFSWSLTSLAIKFSSPDKVSLGSNIPLPANSCAPEEARATQMAGEKSILQSHLESFFFNWRHSCINRSDFVFYSGLGSNPWHHFSRVSHLEHLSIIFILRIAIVEMERVIHSSRKVEIIWAM